MTYIIREIKENDYIEYKNILLQLKNTKDFTIDKFIKILKLCKKQDSQLICLILEEKIIGIAKFFYDIKFGESKGFIDDVVIDKKYRNKGYGTIIINYLLELSKKKNCYIVYIISHLENKTYYEKLNFNNDKLIFHKYLLNSEAKSLN